MELGLTLCGSRVSIPGGDVPYQKLSSMYDPYRSSKMTGNTDVQYHICMKKVVD